MITILGKKALANSRAEAIEEKRRKLEDLLYDFEDYTEAETFEAERFTELQAATRALALNVIDLVKKIKLDPPHKSPAYSAPASSKFPPLPPLPPMPATRSSSVSSSVSGTPVGRAARPRRPPTPAGLRGERSISPPPSLPQKSPDGQPSSSSARADESPSLASMETSDAIPPPLRVAPGRRNNYDRLNMNSTRSQRSVASNRTSRSRISQVSAGSVESMPPPAYTAAGEAMVPVPSLPHDEPPHPRTSRASTPELFPEPRMPHALTTNQEHYQRASQTGVVESEANTVSYSVFPTVPRMSSGGHGTRTNAWVSDQVDSSSRIQPNRPGSRYEPHSLQTLQSLQSLTIPEDKVVGIVRPKHASVIDFSPLTPMLSQLGQFSIESPAASTASGSVDTSSPQQSRMSPLSQGTSVSSFQMKSDHPLPLQTPDETIETRMDPLRANPTLTPLALPAAALEQPHPQSPPLALTSPAQIPPAIPEEWNQGPPTVISDHASVAGFSSHSLSSSQPGVPQPREPDVGIGPRSSLYALHGFCTGAQAFKSASHQDGVRRLAGHVAGVSTTTARCATCSYGHAFSELDLDVNDKSPRATFPRPGGVLFRIRLLYKSHLVAQRPSEAFYGCLFCAQTGAVVREGDATVFRSSDDLFRHLARHPQPLPEVAGVTVLYGKEILTTDPRVNDFDLWLTEDPSPPSPPQPPPSASASASTHMPSLLPELLLPYLPVATAGRSHVQRYAEKKLTRPDGKPAEALLQFFVGARIVGVEFPRAFAGKWCTGWHDGEWGYFPSKLMELEMPKPGRLDAPPLQFQAASAVSVSVVARWKWDPAATIKDALEKGWVAFDKGEKITNVGWPVLVEGVAGGGREAWCWSGTNAKGRFGVFPRSHVDEATLKDDMRPITPGGGGGGGRRKKEGGGKGAAKSLFGVRRRASTSSNFSSGGIAEII